MSGSLDIRAFDSIESIPKSDWGQLWNPRFPFADYAYLHALEKSGSVGGTTGWLPHYLLALESGKIQGASFLYTKADSYGEYIFDWAWAEAYQRHGYPYYPKTISAIPFTPATGPKLLFSKDANREKVAQRLIIAGLQRMESLNHNSLHYLFMLPEEIPFFKKEGFFIRHSFQYHWENRDYASFDDFLSALKIRKKKQILRERSELGSQDVQVKLLTGDDLKPEHAELFYRFYLITIHKMGAIPYLSLEFFRDVFKNMPNEILLFLAKKQEAPIAASLCYFRGDTLYGRYWGAMEEVRNLHFELCYYLPIEWAIANHITKFEAGAQGEHKIPRGFLPSLTYSAHRIKEPVFRDAIGNFIENEKEAIRKLFAEMASHSPFK